MKLLARSGTNRGKTMRKPTFVTAVAMAALGCGDHQIEIAKQLVQTDLAGGAPVVFNIASCEGQSAALPVDRACMIDSNGKTYPEDGSLRVFPAAPPYGAYVLFQPGYVPLSADVGTEGPQPSVSAWAAPYDVQGSPCCAEVHEANRIAARASLTAEGGVLVTVREAVAVGSQVVIALDFGALYRGRLPSMPGGACALPNTSFCGQANSSGYVMRFYVGKNPGAGAMDGPAPVPPASVTPAPGACLLSYNTALASGDPCCYRQGGRNTCAEDVRCNERSGGSCCTLYASDSTRYGQRCCRYEGGGRVDGAEECAALLGVDR
jgi:hypothetical protein